MVKDISEQLIFGALETVIDPEMYISIVDLGLIYGVEIDEEQAITVTMTLTTLGCPLFPVIKNDMRAAIGNLGGTGEVKIKVVFDPPWSVDRMTEKGKAILGV